MITKNTKMLEGIYDITMSTVQSAREDQDWETMARLLELASDLCWRIKSRMDEQEK